MGDILAGVALLPLSKGIFHRVYRIEDTPLVLKEARWDPSFPVGEFEVQLPAQAIRDSIPYLGTALLPGREEARRQYEEDYLLFAEYFGYFDAQTIENPATYPDYDRLSTVQHHVRDKLPLAAAELEDAYGWFAPDGLEELLTSDLRHHNFLPREYLLWGKGHASQNTDNETSFILQEFISGKTLHDVDDAMLMKRPFREQMILLCVLILLLQHERRALPDTRPRQPLWQGHEWLRRTDNIIVSKEGLKFIDTRWLWRRGINPLARGFMIPELMTQSCLTTITSLFG